jgi:ArsR family transcriptional regulator
MENIKETLSEVPDNDILAIDLSDFFKVFGDCSRIKILSCLLQCELCVNDLATILKMNQSAVSHQLRVLRQYRLVKYRRDGKLLLYSLNDTHVENILLQGLEHLSHD